MKSTVRRTDGYQSDDPPPYAIPPTDEIKAYGDGSKFVVASTFSGAGGGCLGLRWAGLDVRFASEFIPAAQDTYRANFDAHLSTDDIRNLTADEIIDSCGRVPDILEGSPPCSPFSASGTRHKGWGEVKQYSDTKQRVDDLFDVWIRLAAELNPKILLAENVPTLVAGKTQGAWIRIVRQLREIGYRPEARILDPQWLGVPQRRKRLIILAFRDDCADVRERFDWPKPLPYRYVVDDACPWMKHGVAGDLTGPECHPPGPYGPVARDGSYFDPETGANIDLRTTNLYDWWVHVEGPGGQPLESRFNLIRIDPFDVCPTIVQQGANKAAASVKHGLVPRNLTLLELRRLCGFPDDFELTGTYPKRYERLGRAVPPPMYRELGRNLVAALSDDV